MDLELACALLYPGATMPISEGVRHVLSTALIVTLAATTVGWTVAGRGGIHCIRHQHRCAPEAAIGCRCHIIPDSPDTARLPQIAPPSYKALSHVSLMAFAPGAPPESRRSAVDITSRHVLQPLDLSVLNRTLLF